MSEGDRGSVVSSSPSFNRMPQGTVTGPPGTTGNAHTGSTAGYQTLREEIEDVCFRQGGYPNEWPRHKCCPCCGCRRCGPSFKKYLMDHWTCNRCKFVYLNPFPPDHIVQRLYNGTYYNSVREHVEQPKALAGDENASMSVSLDQLTLALNLIAKKKDCGTWLDVGGGIGSLANHIRKRFPNMHVVLHEINECSARFAREHYALPVLDAPIETLASGGQTYDVISLIAVLEHVTRPYTFLQQVAALLKPDGYLFLSVPRFSRLNRWISQGSSANTCPPFHVSLFNTSNLKYLIKRVGGLKTVATKYSGPPAFCLADFVQFGDHFDITVATSTSCAKTRQIRPFSPLETQTLNALFAANKECTSYFLAKDGAQILNLIAVKQKSQPPSL